MSAPSLKNCVVLILFWVGTLLFTALAHSENPRGEHAKLALVSEQDAIVLGRRVWVGIRFDLENGWHTYWVNPGDSGEAPRIEWHLPAGFQAGTVQWPFPARLSTPPLADYGYEHQFLLLAPLNSFAQSNDGENVTIAARVHYLVCREVCIPSEKQLELTLPVTSKVPSQSDPLFQVTRQRLPQRPPATWRISAVSDEKQFVLTLRGKGIAFPQFFPLDAEEIENAATQNTTTTTGGIHVYLVKSKHLLKPIRRLHGVLVVGSVRAYWIDVPVSNRPKDSEDQ